MVLPGMSRIVRLLRRPPSSKARLAFDGLLLLLAVGLGVWSQHHGGLLDLEEWRNGAGWATPLLFVLVFGLLSLVFVPRPALAAAAGILFTVPIALLVAAAGTVLAAAGAFGIARVLGQRPLAPLLRRGRLHRLDSLLERRGFAATVLCRLVPVVPFAVVNYTAGMTRVRVIPFLAGTAVGTVPANVSYVMFGGAVVSEDASGPWLALGTAAAVLVAGLAHLGRARLRSPRGPSTEAAGGPEVG